MNNKKLYFLLALILLILTFLLSSNLQKKNDNKKIAITATPTISQAVLITETPIVTAPILTKTTFTTTPLNWYEHIWYKKASSTGEVTFGVHGLSLKGVATNSRSGLMFDLNTDISMYKSVTINASVVAVLQTLSGTGFNGREAPVAIAVAYTDAQGVEHTSLTENPSYLGNMFWRGFYYLTPTNASSGIMNGVKVEKNVPYTFTFDLMTLDPKPVTLHFVGVEGAGWKERTGYVEWIEIVGLK